MPSRTQHSPAAGANAGTDATGHALAAAEQPSSEERAAMRRAIELARRGLGRTSPNPVVGCAVLDAAGAMVGQGWHARAGGPHAEVVALADAGAGARGGTAVVTLEPCAHSGRTGPCTEALLAAGIARVVVALPDPTETAGGGADVLRAAGVQVVSGVLADEAAAANIAWLTSVRLSRPYVTWKYAATLDGRTAAADGTSRWITGPAARADVHRLRDEVDAVLVGTGTALADDPTLTVRDLPDHDGRQPLRVVLGERPLPAGSRLLDGAGETLQLRQRDPHAALATLHERGVRHVLVEGGATVAGAFVAAGLIDQVIGYHAPALLGAGSPLLAGAGIGTIAEALRLEVTDVRRVGSDVRVTARPVTSERED